MTLASPSKAPPFLQAPSRFAPRATIFAAYAAGLTFHSVTAPFRPFLSTRNRPGSSIRGWPHFRLDRPLCGCCLEAAAHRCRGHPRPAYKNGCGWQNAGSFSKAGGAASAPKKLTCEMAAALALGSNMRCSRCAIHVRCPRRSNRRYGHLRLPQHRRQSADEERAQSARHGKCHRHIGCHA